MTDNELDHRKADPSAVDVVALCPDLLFASKIRGAGRGLGVRVEVVRSAARVLSELEGRPGRRTLVLVDLAAARDGVDAIAEVRERFPAVEVVAFAPHVATEIIQAARAAGAGRVLARSAFAAQLPDILAGR